jgi:hypothetical protein
MDDDGCGGRAAGGEHDEAERGQNAERVTHRTPQRLLNRKD